MTDINEVWLEFDTPDGVAYTRVNSYHAGRYMEMFRDCGFLSRVVERPGTDWVRDEIVRRQKRIDSDNRCILQLLQYQ